MTKKNNTEPETISSPTPETGAILKASRKRLGLDLRNVAEDLCIRYKYLLAIEEGRYEELPGSTYAIGFVRAFAEHVGIDGDEAVNRFKQENKGFTDSPRLSFSEPIAEAALPGKAIILIGFLLAIGVYGIWYVKTPAPVSPDVIISDVPHKIADNIIEESEAIDTAVEEALETDNSVDETQEIIEEKTEKPVKEQTEKIVKPIPEKKTEVKKQPEKKPVEKTAETQPEKIQDKKQPAVEDVPEITFDNTAVEEKEIEQDVVQKQEKEQEIKKKEEYIPRQYGEENINSRITLIAKYDSWVQVTKGDVLLLTRVLKKGDTYKVPDVEGVTLNTGNAGGIALIVDGKDVPPLGPSGSIRRNVMLEAEKLLEGTATQN